MHTSAPPTSGPSAGMMTRSWQAGLVLGALTLILGIVVAAHPTGTLNVIAVLIGILLLLSGIFNVVRAFDAGEAHRVWLGIGGLIFIVAGVYLIRHLSVTVAIIGLIVGITWIVQGVVALLGGLSGGHQQGRGWWIFFGIVSLLAGIVVVAVPVHSVTFLTVLVGIWFIVMGIFEIIGSLILRHSVRSAQA